MSAFELHNPPAWDIEDEEAQQRYLDDPLRQCAGCRVVLPVSQLVFSEGDGMVPDRWWCPKCEAE